MRTTSIFIAIIIGFISGFILGIVISEWMGIYGMAALNQPIGIKFLPYVIAVIFAALASVIDYKSNNKKGRVR